ncbi:unnamed protein product [Symbiodinium microadriaticum]|nr:unnamed protein product [Symbiodinium sp. KB8]CAE7890759.1 unnamed protein product [Symbiodinium microadriaticum]
MYSGPLGARLPTMQRFADSLALKLREEAAPTAPAAQVAERRADERSSVAPWGQFRDVIREEMSAAFSAMQDTAARPMQFIIHNNAQAKVEQHTVTPHPAPPSPPPPPREPATFLEGVFQFFASPWNRLCIFSAVGIGQLGWQL